MVTPRMFEWTLEHHKQFLDTFILLGGDYKKVGAFEVLRAELLTLVGCCCTSFFLVKHSMLLEELQKKSESLFCNSNKVSLKGLYVAPIKLSSSWTLEHHRRVVEAVIQLGGLSNSKATPKAVLKLMAEEDRRHGLTARMISHHLSELSRLQKETQRLISRRPSCVQQVDDRINIDNHHTSANAFDQNREFFPCMTQESVRDGEHSTQKLPREALAQLLQVVELKR